MTATAPIPMLDSAGKTFLRTFAAALVVYSAGVLAAPNLNRLAALGVAALLAAISAGVKAVVVYIPEVSFVHWVGVGYGRFLDAFAHGALASLAVTLIGILGAPDLSTAHSLAVAGIVGAVNAGFRAIQAMITPGETPIPVFGLPTPRPPQA